MTGFYIAVFLNIAFVIASAWFAAKDVDGDLTDGDWRAAVFDTSWRFFAVSAMLEWFALNIVAVAAKAGSNAAQLCASSTEFIFGLIGTYFLLTAILVLLRKTVNNVLAKGIKEGDNK